ncbi:hypothetical protein I4U23_023163 [Adineta vaga]|nr:hypothetical protein I4U23_023163 [Adineta vaga]
MMKRFFLPFMFISICIARQDPSRIIHGIFYNSDQTHVYYGSVDLNTAQFNILNSLNINDVGNPKDSKYPVSPLTYDPNNDIVYMSAQNTENKQIILSVLNATTGALINAYHPIQNEIISLQYDIFQKQLFAYTETNEENVTQIVEIDTTNGHFKQILGTIHQAKPTHISSYCPICRKYFLIALQNNHYVYIGVNSTDGGGISWQTPINFAPISMKFDYKTFTMYTVYLNQTDKIASMVGILNRTIGGIGQVVGRISEDSNVVATSLSAYDIAENIYYSSIQLTWPYAGGVSCLNVNTTLQHWIFLPKSQYNSYGWFIKQFVH